ncbi:hypothetical protein [Streptomyces sp. WM6386]|uniref:hypothetical protein n=1 Tax=Streptomyces sp. WM6386 TaxID=1415558 RepID=UPI0006194C92|nr:hypothetical protein [Streptomyces sp. WM6386]KKD05506.1 hypothetical protein TN53_23995 [Streptomyces sp. WM6386]
MSSTRTWLRAFVLLLALLVPGGHAGAHAALAVAPVAGEAAEHDVVDTALRPPARAAHRPVVPLRPAPRPAPAPGVPAGRPLPAPPRPPYALHTLRSVVLRC